MLPYDRFVKEYHQDEELYIQSIFLQRYVFHYENMEKDELKLVQGMVKGIGIKKLYYQTENALLLDAFDNYFKEEILPKLLS